MTPARRIRRIQRWTRNGRAVPLSNSLHLPPCGMSHAECDHWIELTEKADLLFAAELAWLCRYSLGLHALTAGTCIEQMAESAAVEPPETFTCSACRRSVHWSEGAADSHPDLCNDCIPEALP